MARSLIVKIIGDASSLQREFAKADAAGAKLGTGLHRVSKVSAVAGAAILGGLAYGLDKSVKAAIDSEKATARLDTAFRTAGLSSSKYAEAIDKAEASGRKLGFTDTATKESLGSLITATRDVHKATTDLAVARDYARFKGVSLEAATKTLTMAMTGGQRATKALGFAVPPVTTNMDRLKAAHKAAGTEITKTEAAQAKLADKMATGQAVIDAVTKKVHGQAQAFAGTAAGGMQQFHAQLERLEVSLGSALLPALGSVAAAFADAFGFLGEHTTLTKGLVIALTSLGGVLITVGAATKVYAAAQKIAAASSATFKAAQAGLAALMAGNPWAVLATAAVIALGAAYMKLTGDTNPAADAQRRFAGAASAAADASRKAAAALRDQQAATDRIKGSNLDVREARLRLQETAAQEKATRGTKQHAQALIDYQRAVIGVRDAERAQATARSDALKTAKDAIKASTDLVTKRREEADAAQKVATALRFTTGDTDKMMAAQKRADTATKNLSGSLKASEARHLAVAGEARKAAGAITGTGTAAQNTRSRLLNLANTQISLAAQAATVRSVGDAANYALGQIGALYQRLQNPPKPSPVHITTFYDSVITKAKQANEVAQRLVYAIDSPALRAKIAGARTAFTSAFDAIKEKALTAFDAIAEKSRSAFDALTAAGSPLMQQIGGTLDLISARRQDEDQTQAVTDAENALNEARTSGDPEAIKNAERNLARAREDITITGLQRQLAKETERWEEERRNAAEATTLQNADQRAALEERLTDLGTHFENAKGVAARGSRGITDILAAFIGDYRETGSLLGNAFVAAFGAAIGVGVETARRIISLPIPVGPPKTGKTGPVIPAAMMAAGGILRQPTLAVVAERGPEAVIPLTQAGSYLSGGPATYVFNFPNYVGSQRQLAAVMRNELVKMGRRQPSVLGGLA